MGEVVLDASAVLAVLFAETGSEVVAPLLPYAKVSAVNFSEVLARASRLCGSLAEAERRVGRHRFTVVPFDTVQATITASLVPVTSPKGLGLADRACLGLALALDVPVYTADRAWADLDIGVRVHLIR